MTLDTRIQDLLQRWQELRRQGQVLSAEELCRDCPELIGEVQRHLATVAFAAPAPSDIDQPTPPTRPPLQGGTLGAATLLPPPVLVQGYTLVHELGRGGFGAVWKAHGPGGFSVALKFIRLDQLAVQPELRSLELVQDIRHPHLLSLFGAWHRDGWLIVAMELADGTLAQRFQEALRQGQPGIPGPELLRYMEEAARGLDYLNERGFQHRDVKPQNLLLVGGGVKVGDFGLAKLLEQSLASHSGAMTPAYAAPEFLEGKTSTRSDQYALAVTYYQLRSGRLPFTGNVAQMLDGHFLHPPDVSVLPAAERAAVARALAKDPLARWPTCQAFIAALAGGSPAGVGTLVHIAPSTTEEMPLPLPADESDLPLPLPSMDLELPLPRGPGKALTPATPTVEFHAAAGPEPRLTLDSEVAPRKPQVPSPSASHYALAAEDTKPALRPGPPPQFADEDQADEESADNPPAGLLGSVISVADTIVAVLRFGLDSLLTLPPRVVGAFLALLVTVVLVLACISLRLFIQ
jgi:serine/threonine protein kinase